ncbi:uncharacterized protein LOC131934658 isoform X1 [Physella acuta]|uniref:uncharacterized protein LOC131934658 isoform X1 n=1 Tax=Physella acuta TaxID=109671 RepID=UPI0027DE9833|nr:uncharacterized protein LOC131934658 isoform X1 [Physella acuta]XP_059146717.1 uncharacterized protein LOC131934658 isoform X1 [Physella acuta]
MSVFKRDYLPENYQNNTMYNLVWAISDLVVRLSVVTHTLRPKVFPGTDDPYPRNSKINGSGRIIFAKKFRGQCQCPDCLSTGNYVYEWAEIKILTAAHVVNNYEEVAGTTCEYHFGHFKGTLKGYSLYSVNVEHDRAELICVTHDMSLVNAIIGKIYSFRSLDQQAKNMYGPSERKKVFIIVSHPHGYDKHVTFGYRVETVEIPINNYRRYTYYKYSAKTCGGSSGAPVYFVGKENTWTTHVHKGYHPDGIGESGTEWENVDYNFNQRSSANEGCHSPRVLSNASGCNSIVSELGRGQIFGAGVAIVQN